MKKTLNFSVIWIKFSAFVINEKEKKKKKRKKEIKKERKRERKKERKFIIAWQLVKSSPCWMFLVR